jgi:hypothetical protein
MKLRILLLTMLAVILGLTTVGPNPAVAQGAPKGYARIVHAALGAPAVDIYLNNAAEPAIANLAFGQARGFLAFDPGNYQVAVRAAGSAANSAPVIRGSFRVQANLAVEVAAVGSPDQRGAGALRLINFPVNVTPTDGKARVYLVHSSPVAGASVDLVSGAKVILGGVRLGQVSRQPAIVDPGTYGYKIVSADGTEIAALPVFELNAESVYVIYSVKLEEGATSVQPLVLKSLTLKGEVAARPFTGTIRVTHASPGAPNVDIYLNGSSVPAITNLAFGASTDLITLTSANYDVAIRRTGDPAVNPPLFSKSITLPAGVTAEVVALGVVGGEPAFDIAVFPIDLKPTNGKARIYFIHAGTTAPSVDIRVNGQLVITGLKVGSYTTTPLEVGPGEYTATGVETGKNFPVVLSLAAAQIAKDTVYTVVAYGDLRRTTPIVLTATPAAK